MVRIHPDPPTNRAGLGPDYGFRSPEFVDRRAKGAVAQLGERLLCKQEVIGSIPFSSTNRLCRRRTRRRPRNFKRGLRQASNRLPLVFRSARKAPRLLFKKTEEVKRTRCSKSVV